MRVCSIILVILFSVTMAGAAVQIAEAASSHEEGYPVRVQIMVKPEYKETRYWAWARDKGEISLTSYQSEINRGVVTLRSRSGVATADQVEIIGRLFKALLDKEPDNPPRTLAAGRLIRVFGKDLPWMSMRLCMAAVHSGLWDTGKGEAVSGHKNDAVTAMANHFPIYPELSDLFSGFNLTLSVQSVEKVLVGQARTLPFAAFLREQGVSPGDRLPYDCLVWFSLSPGQ